MRRAHRFSAACMILVVFAQGTGAKPPSCESDSGERRMRHEHHSTISFGHEATPGQDLSVASIAGVVRSGSPDTPDSGSCVAATHCGFHPVALDSRAPTVELPFVVGEGPGSTWSVHGTSTTHATPPPRA